MTKKASLPWQQGREVICVEHRNRGICVFLFVGAAIFSCFDLRKFRDFGLL